jgi:raffinose/stachyose/melibiose transport system permease protein
MTGKKSKRMVASLLLAIASIVYVSPLFIILFNSFKQKTFINLEPFKLPTADTWAGNANYLASIQDYGFLKSVVWTLIITIGSVVAILIFCSMFAWFINRARTAYARVLYMLCVFSMVVPFQMVMFTLSKTADTLNLNTPWGIIIVYRGFGAGLSVFLFSGFVKSIPLEIEEAATIDGCGPVSTFFRIVLPIMQPTYITVGILQTMWIWNDFLLPYLVLDQQKYKTISMIIQMMKGSFGRVDMGAIMACLVMAVIPMIIFYLAAQKHIIEGVAAGAVKG